MRRISDEYELSEDDDDYIGLIRPRRSRHIGGWVVLLINHTLIPHITPAITAA